MIQYQRRHNEKDGRLFYCDYCDVFVSRSDKVWQSHLQSAKHMSAVEGYYHMASQVEGPWLSEIRQTVARSHSQAMLQSCQVCVGGVSSVLPLAPMRVAPHIVVGGLPPVLPSPDHPQAPPVLRTCATSIPTIRVGNTVVYAEGCGAVGTPKPSASSPQVIIKRSPATPPPPQSGSV